LALKVANVKSFCSLPATLSRLSALTMLSLERYCDNVQTHALLHLTALKYLSLVENPTRATSNAAWIHNLPPSLAGLEVVSRSNLDPWLIHYVVDRDAPLLRTVPCITRLTHLTYLSCTLLKGFGAGEWVDKSSFAGLTDLRSLDLYNCRLKVVPGAVLGLSGLRCLSLDSNRFKALPLGPYLGHLETLSLAGNQFSILPAEALIAATALTSLLIEGNPLAWTADQEEAVAHIEDVVGLPLQR
jgi:Leucine-rich repeat (LRR) protein